MADIIVDLDNKNPEELFAQGVRAYVIHDFNSSVQALSKASELYVEKYGSDEHESLGEVYLYYGKALLDLCREQSDALGEAVPKNIKEDSDGEEEDEGEAEAEGEAEDNNAEASAEGDEQENNEKEVDEEKKDTEEKNGESKTENKDEGETEQPSSSTEKPEDGEDASDLQVAWEVLELARKIFEKQDNKKNLSEALVVLGEVSLESGCFDQAINDLKNGLELQKSIYSKDSRIIAGTLYKLGMAYSTNSEVDEAIKCFNESLEYLKNRIEVLEKMENKEQVVEEEIKSLRDLMPEIEERIVDTKTLVDEALKKIVSSVLNPKQETNGNQSSSSDQPVNNISHLVKRKRKLEDVIEEKKESIEIPAKKPSP